MKENSIKIMKSKEENKDKYNVIQWLEFSMHPQSEDDIRKKLLEEIEMGTLGYNVCVSYVCRYSRLSEEFIEELIKLTQTDRKIQETVPGTKRTRIVVVKSSRVDWINICQYQKLSEEFIERHENDVLWKLIYKFQVLSDDFKIKHIDQLSQEMQERLLISEDASEHIQ